VSEIVTKLEMNTPYL